MEIRVENSRKETSKENIKQKTTYYKEDQVRLPETENSHSNYVNVNNANNDPE